MRRRLPALGLAAALAFPAGAALAHAFLDHATPPVGSTLAAAPARVQIWFTQGLEPAFSGVSVTDETGARFDDGAPRIDSANPALMIVRLKPLHPGTYTVRWHVVSIDTHRTEGDFTFTVAGP